MTQLFTGAIPILHLHRGGPYSALKPFHCVTIVRAPFSTLFQNIIGRVHYALSGVFTDFVLPNVGYVSLWTAT